MTPWCQPGSVCVPALRRAPLKQLLFLCAPNPLTPSPCILCLLHRHHRFPGGPCTVPPGPFCSQRRAHAGPTSGLRAAASSISQSWPRPCPPFPPLPCPSPRHPLLAETSGSSAFIFQLLLRGLGCVVGRASSRCLSYSAFLCASLRAFAASVNGALRMLHASFP